MRVNTYSTGFFKREGIENYIWPTPPSQINLKSRWERKEKGKEGEITIVSSCFFFSLLSWLKIDFERFRNPVTWSLQQSESLLDKDYILRLLFPAEIVVQGSSSTRYLRESFFFRLSIILNSWQTEWVACRKNVACLNFNSSDSYLIKSKVWIVNLYIVIIIW